MGLTAQYLEGFARKLLGGLLGGLGRQTAGSGMAFISTYCDRPGGAALLCRRPPLEAVQLRDVYQSMLADARAAAGAGEIQRRASALRAGSLAEVLRSA